MNDIAYQSASETAAVLRTRAISARELMEHLLDRIEAINPRLNAVVEVRRERALADASDADRAIRDGHAGPLLGVPMTIKDCFQVAGLHNTWGNPVFAQSTADWDATVVRRLQDAGAIVIGKTNVPFMLGDFGRTSNDIYGVTRNPWNAERTPGGSSGGAAAALAAGLTFLEYGSDVVGSIRIPAAFCGVYGLKPSAGSVPFTGVQPPGPPATPVEAFTVAAVGPLARSASDLRLALQVTAGPESPTSAAYTWHLAPPRRTRLRDYRVGVVLDHPRARCSSDVGSVLAECVQRLARGGVTIKEGWPEGVDPVRAQEAFGFHVRLFFAYQQPQDGFDRLPEYVQQEHERMRLRAAWQRYFDEVDVLLCPATFAPAFAHDQRPIEACTTRTPEGDRAWTDQVFWVAQASLAGLPSVVAPLGRTPDGLPVAVQIIGPPFEDDTAITFAELLVEVIGGYERPPIDVETSER